MYLPVKYEPFYKFALRKIKANMFFENANIQLPYYDMYCTLDYVYFFYEYENAARSFYCY